MITAKEAQQLYYDSGVELDAYMKNKVEPLIKGAAICGKRFVNVHIGSLDTYTAVSSKITPFETSVIDRLRKLGYAIKVERIDEAYVPKALQDDEGKGPLYHNYGFVIHW